MAQNLSRRTLLGRTLAWAAGIPILGAAVGATSPLVRLLRPTLGPYDFNKPPDAPPPVPAVAGTISDLELSYEWGSKDFVFNQLNVEYTPNHLNRSTIPGYVVRIPREVAQKYASYFRTAPGVSANSYAPATADAIEKHSIAVFSRICVHLGCIFNYFGPRPNPGAPAADITEGPQPGTDRSWTQFNNAVQSKYNYPGAKPDQGYFACPCHFSVYDLNQFDVDHDSKLGKVVSGPAPRPPRFFYFTVDDSGSIIVKAVESGGIA